MSRRHISSKRALHKPQFAAESRNRLANAGVVAALTSVAALASVAFPPSAEFWLGGTFSWPAWAGHRDTLIATAATIGVVVCAFVWRFLGQSPKHHPRSEPGSDKARGIDDHLQTSSAAPWKFILPADATSVYDGYFSESPMLQQLAGLTASDTIRTLGDLTKRMPEADVVKLLGQIRACLARRGATIDIIVRVDTGGRQFRKVLIRGAAPVQASGPGLRTALGIVVDLGHANGADEVSALLHGIFDSADEHYAVVDGNGLLMACNAALNETLGPGGSNDDHPAMQRLALVGPDHMPLRSLLALASKNQRWEGDVWVENGADAGRPQHMYGRIVACRSQATTPECFWISLSFEQPIPRDAVPANQRDALTGLPQSRSFTQQLAADLAGANADVDVRFVVVRLDNVVDINRGFGIEAGDQVIRTVADRLAALPGTALARTSGTRFCVILPAGISEKTMHAWLSRARRELAQPVLVDGETIMPELAIEATRIQADETPVQALRRAESDHHAGAEMPTSQTVLTAESRIRVLNRTAVRRAMSDDGLRCFYQPIVSVDDGSICGAEALTRISAAGAQLAPAAWWPAADGLGLLPKIDHWILSQALEDVATWQAEGIIHAGFTLSVNASADTITEAWKTHVTQCLARTGVAPDLLRIEITEQNAMADPQRCAAILEPLRALGIRIALDDFGTGMSSLAQLGELPVDIIKIDRSFVRGLPDSPSACEMVTSMLHLAERLNLAVVVEGVETRAQHDYLAGLGCKMAQGFLYSKAIPGTDFRARLLDADQAGVRDRAR